MQIIDLNEEHRESWLQCLEEWSPEAREGRARRAAWYERVKDKGLLVKLAVDEDGALAGMVQAVPVEQGFVEGEGLYQILCIWVHGHKRGVGNRQGRGMGRALLAAIEAEARARGARGMAAWGISGPLWMRAGWFKKHGYMPVDRDGLAVLLFKPFRADALPPRWLRRRWTPAAGADALQVVCFSNGWCTAQNAVCERARAAAEAFGPEVRFKVVETGDREVSRSWGISDALFIGGRRVNTGPPPSEKHIRASIGRRLRLRRWRRQFWRSGPDQAGEM